MAGVPLVTPEREAEIRRWLAKGRGKSGSWMLRDVIAALEVARELRGDDRARAEKAEAELGQLRVDVRAYYVEPVNGPGYHEARARLRSQGLIP